MKKYLTLLLLSLAGCQASPPPAPKPSPAPVSAMAAEVAPPAPNHALERTVRQQAQYIEALVSQNEALSARVAAPSEPYPSPVARALMKPLTNPPAPIERPAAPSNPDRNMLVPNADGMIDLTVAATGAKTEEKTNPFAVRTLPADSVREVSLQVGGIVAGPVACAVINDRLVQAGDTIESLAVERIESDGVVLRHAGQRLRLPVGGKTLRVRLPI